MPNFDINRFCKEAEEECRLHHVSRKLSNMNSLIKNSNNPYWCLRFSQVLARYDLDTSEYEKIIIASSNVQLIYAFGLTVKNASFHKCSEALIRLDAKELVESLKEELKAKKTKSGVQL